MQSSATITETYAWLDAETRDDSIDATALCTLIAMKINAPEKMKLFSYIESNSTSMLLVNMERMIFVTNYIKDASLTAAYLRTRRGKDYRTEKGSSFGLILPLKAGFDKNSSISGNIVAARSYIYPLSG